ncbi:MULTISPECIES: hypothetical protein [Bacillus]|uniref:hypothetical protein n=1 Tax=Bacillus TaxID=1386 RepID=UPI001C034481|nr:hypothetical protein [Bacillus mycoides]MED1022294.1 hypothetical protein [Bacillus mycoides]
MKHTRILKDVIEDAFSAIISCGEIGHMLKPFVFSYTADLHTETSRTRSVPPPALYN